MEKRSGDTGRRPTSSPRRRRRGPRAVERPRAAAPNEEPAGHEAVAGEEPTALDVTLQSCWPRTRWSATSAPWRSRNRGLHLPGKPPAATSSISSWSPTEYVAVLIHARFFNLSIAKTGTRPAGAAATARGGRACRAAPPPAPSGAARWSAPSPRCCSPLRFQRRWLRALLPDRREARPRSRRSSAATLPCACPVPGCAYWGSGLLLLDHIRDAHQGTGDGDDGAAAVGFVREATVSLLRSMVFRVLLRFA